MSDAQNLNSDYGYYNFIINNQNHTKSINAELDETRIAPVLSKQEDWQVAVARFKVPGVSIPLFIFEQDNIAAPNDPPNYVSPYIITFSIGPNFQNPIQRRVLLVPDFENNELTIRPQRNFIYYYSSFLGMVNNTLINLWADVLADAAYNALTANLTDLEGPYFELKQADSFINIVLPMDQTRANPCPFIDDGVNPYINIHMSQKLFYFFSGFPSKLLSPTHGPIIGETPYLLHFGTPQNAYTRVYTLTQWGTTFPNPRIVTIIPQDYSCLYLWQKLSRILLTTSIPIEQELVGVRDLNGNNFTSQILTDFEIPPVRDGSQRDYIYFFPEGPLRYTNFTSNGPLRRFDIRIMFQTNDLQTFPLELPPGFEATVKLQFKRRKARALLQYGAETSYKYR